MSERARVSPVPDEVKPTVLTAKRPGKTDINVQTRLVTFDVVHPNGILGAYQVAIPIDQIKDAMAVLLKFEAQHEATAITARH